MFCFVYTWHSAFILFCTFWLARLAAAVLKFAVVVTYVKFFWILRAGCWALQLWCIAIIFWCGWSMRRIKKTMVWVFGERKFWMNWNHYTLLKYIVATIGVHIRRRRCHKSCENLRLIEKWLQTTINLFGFRSHYAADKAVCHSAISIVVHNFCQFAVPLWVLFVWLQRQPYVNAKWYPVDYMGEQKWLGALAVITLQLPTTKAVPMRI